MYQPFRLTVLFFISVFYLYSTFSPPIKNVILSGQRPLSQTTGETGNSLHLASLVQSLCLRWSHGLGLWDPASSSHADYFSHHGCSSKVISSEHPWVILLIPHLLSIKATWLAFFKAVITTWTYLYTCLLRLPSHKTYWEERAFAGVFPLL